MKLIDNAGGNVSQGITLDSTNKADRYKLSYNCSNIGSGKSFVRIYATLSDSSYKTYFMPVQFSGALEFEMSIDTQATFLQFDMIGDAILTEITFETVVDATMEYVKENAAYWDRIKDVTSKTGKLKSELLEGIINTSLNKIYAPGYLNEGNTSVWETETEATMINPDGMYRANSKKDDGTWDWKPFTAGAGINADAIVTGILRAIEISGVSITGSTMTTGTLTGCTLIGGELYIGDNPPKNGDISNYTGMVITKKGVINGYINGSLSYTLVHANEGRLILRDGNKSLYMDSANTRIYSTNNDLSLVGGLPSFDEYGTMNNSYITIENSSGDIYISCDRGRGTVHVVGNLQVDGTIEADNI